MILLKDALAEMIGRRDLEQITEDQYKRSLKSFELFLRRQATDSDLTPDRVNDWIRSLQGSGRSPTTCCNYKVGLLTIWNYLAESRRIAPYIGKEIRQPKIVRKPVIAWSQKEVKSLLQACDLLCGELRNGTPASDVMRAWVLLGFETGLRPVDLRLLTLEDFNFNDMVVMIVQHKTGNQHTCRFSERTAQAVKAICSKGSVFAIGKTGIRKWEKKLFALASLHFGFETRKGSGLGTLRKSHATEVFKEMGIAAAAQSLGHVGSTTTATRHYIDSRVRFSGILPTLS